VKLYDDLSAARRVAQVAMATCRVAFSMYSLLPIFHPDMVVELKQTVECVRCELE